MNKTINAVKLKQGRAYCHWCKNEIEGDDLKEIVWKVYETAEGDEGYSFHKDCINEYEGELWEQHRDQDRPDQDPEDLR